MTVLALSEAGVPDIWAKADTAKHGNILGRVGAHHVIYRRSRWGSGSLAHCSEPPPENPRSPNAASESIGCRARRDLLSFIGGSTGPERPSRPADFIRLGEDDSGAG